ncbi:nucleolar protein 16-like [Oscarella lobularis]|uniref:nucleolar protein 16-like n=1 Tax=Oscarella lobularis TaxID=121494 RepID=UPI0033144D05
MASARTRKARKRVKARSTKPAFKQKRKNRKLKFEGPIGDAYDSKKTLRENFKAMGLVLDPNEPTDGNRTKTSVVEALEQDAASRQRKGPSPRHIAPGEAKFLSDLIQKYGTNYEAMARDESNRYQHTPNQIQRKCRAFLERQQS